VTGLKWGGPGGSGAMSALFAWFISHQPAVLFSHNKSGSSTLFSEQISTSYQPPTNRTGWRFPVFLLTVCHGGY
jgi:hypothetical protein